MKKVIIYFEKKLFNSNLFQIVPCGTGGTSCTKSVTVNVGSKNASEGVTLNKDDDGYLKKSFKKYVSINLELSLCGLILRL